MQLTRTQVELRPYIGAALADILVRFVPVITSSISRAKPRSFSSSAAAGVQALQSRDFLLKLAALPRRYDRSQPRKLRGIILTGTHCVQS
jgi:hypothetical protein